MEKPDNIELFDRYIEGTLSAAEREAFEADLASNAELCRDFRTYLLILRAAIQESEQDNAEFGIAMERLSDQELTSAIAPISGRKRRVVPLAITKILKVSAWAASIILIVSFGLFLFMPVGMAPPRPDPRMDRLIVSKWEVSAFNRADSIMPQLSDLSEEEVREMIPNLEEKYRNLAPEDEQDRQVAGLTLALAYIRIHQHHNASRLLKSLMHQFPEDESFVEECTEILDFIN